MENGNESNSPGATRATLMRDSWLAAGPGRCGGALGDQLGGRERRRLEALTPMINFSIKMTSFDMAGTQAARELRLCCVPLEQALIRTSASLGLAD